VPASRRTNAAVAVATPACVEIGRLADELRREHPEMLRSEALAKIYGTHRELAERAKREQVFDDQTGRDGDCRRPDFGS
jgi:hypothetical protein